MDFSFFFFFRSEIDYIKNTTLFYEGFMTKKLSNLLRIRNNKDAVQRQSKEIFWFGLQRKSIKAPLVEIFINAKRKIRLSDMDFVRKNWTHLLSEVRRKS